MKNGPGTFLYLDKGQVYSGTWVDDIAKCGTLEDFGREGAPDPPIYPIPQVLVHHVIDEPSLLHSFCVFFSVLFKIQRKFCGKLGKHFKFV